MPGQNPGDSRMACNNCDHCWDYSGVAAQTSCPSCSQSLTISANQIGIYAPNGVLVDPGDLEAEERVKLIRIFRSEHPIIQTAVKTILED